MRVVVAVQAEVAAAGWLAEGVQATADWYFANGYLRTDQGSAPATGAA